MPFLAPIGAAIAGGIGAGAAAVGSAVSGLVGGGIASAVGTIASVGTGAFDLIKSGLGGAAGVISGISQPVANAIGEASSLVNNVVAPIKKTVDSITGIVNGINDKLVIPISSAISGTQTAVNGLIDALHSDLGNGLKGLVKLPQDLANAFNSADAQLARSQQELASQQADIARTIFKPALEDSIGAPLQTLSTSVVNPLFEGHQQAAFEAVIKLNESVTSDDVIKAVQGFEDTLTKPTGLVGHIVSGLWGIAKLSDFAIAQLRQQLVDIEQRAQMSTPLSLLSPGEVIEAVRRGLISADDQRTELLKHGYDDTRQQVLYDLAQFLFSPTDAVNLLARGIISDADYKDLIAQNNLDEDQAAALTELLNHILGPGDIAAANARGYVNHDAFEALRKSAKISTEIMGLVEQLELSLISPEKMIALYGRDQARQAGVFADMLNIPTPGSIVSQFNRTQAEEGAADLAWLGHWKVPGPEWWVDAYFRGLRTRTEVEAGFTANNVPEAIWDDIFAVEEELPPVWLIPDIIASGVWTEAEAIPQFRKLGFSEANAKVLYDYGYSKSKASKAATAGDLQKISLGNAKTLFDDGIITSGEYTQILLDHGYSQDAADLTTQLAEFEAATKQRDQAAQDVVDQANLGEINESQVQSQLYSYGFTEAEVAKWLLKLHKTKAAKARLPTEAELTKMLKKGVISDTIYLDTLVALGYSPTWAARIYEIQ